MLPVTSPRKKLKSPGQDTLPNPKTTITCTNVPESLFEPNAATQHFSKFGRVVRIRLFPKKLACMIEYDQPSAIERAMLNAGAYDGFMFNVTRMKARVRKPSKAEGDPDWVPDSDVARELSAMRGAPTYVTRNKMMDVESESATPKVLKRVIKQTIRKVPVRQPVPKPRQLPIQSQPVVAGGTESPIVVTTQTTMTTSEAALELHQLRSKVSITADEQWRTLDARDRILRSWGGAGSRVKVGGATIGTCQEMCPEKEMLHRQAEHQIMLLETDASGSLEPRRAVKQYSRSSADQEIPMCYELRPPAVLMRTCAYLLHEVADTSRQISLADWFHFMWDRLRSIRKDITQQALCCSESICLVEMCARFHAHCAARLADLEHTQFDQKLNTDNLTKCLQTLKHMYTDVTDDQKPREAEFRGYIALLNLGDANFWWEIKQLPEEIQKSEHIIFAIKVFNALDNNNYVKFFRLVKEEATYLQACILLRYFNDVRARALARIVKAFAPRGGSRFPAADLVKALAFESTDKMKAFINHYGLRFAKADDYELSVILDRNQFIEDSDPFATARAIELIETKRNCTVGHVIAGGYLPEADYFEHVLHTSFNKDGKLKETSLIAEEQYFNTANDSNKNVQALKAEIQRLAKDGKSSVDSLQPKNIFVKPDTRNLSPRRKATTAASEVSDSKLFTFKPAITVAATEIINNSPEKTFDTEDVFSFSKPEVSEKEAATLFSSQAKRSAVFSEKVPDNKCIFSRPDTENKKADVFGVTKNNFSKPDLSKSTKPEQNVFSKPAASVFGKNEVTKPIFSTAAKPNDLFSKPEMPNSVFAQSYSEPKIEPTFKPNKNLFSKPDLPQSKFGQISNKNSPFGGETTKENIFSKPEVPKALFGQTFGEPKTDIAKSVFGQQFESKQESSGNVFVLKPALSNNTDSKSTFVSNNLFASAKDNSLTTPDSALQFTKGSNIFAKAASNLGDTNQAATSIFANSLQKSEEPKPNIFATTREQNKQSSSIFSKATHSSGDTKAGHSIFGNSEIKPSSLFSAVNKPTDPKSIFVNNDVGEKKTPSIFTTNGDVPANKLSPGSVFKTAINPPNGSDGKDYSIFKSKNKAQTVADNIYNSVMAPKTDSLNDFNQNTEVEQKQIELQRLQEENIKQEQERQLQEKIRKEEQKRQEDQKRREELRKQEEERYKAEEKRKQEEASRLLEEKRRLEEQIKQEELRIKLEEERKAELKRKSEEERRKFLEAVDTESTQLVEELLTEINNEISQEILKEEQKNFRQLINFVGDTTEDIMTELCNEICSAELRAEVFLTRRIMRKWFDHWRRQLIRNVNRRKWLDDTPVWLPTRDPIQQALHMRRKVEDAVLKSMNAFHRGYIFSGKPNLLPPPEKYNLMDIIRSPFLKRMKQISYPYDKCFFWKITLVSPGENQWLSRRINVEKWLLEAFADSEKHEESDTLIYVGKQSWNHLMDFAISVSLAKRESKGTYVDAVEGSNGLIFYSVENDKHLLETIEEVLKSKYTNQIIPVAVIMPHQNDAIHNNIQTVLAEYVQRNIISGFKIFIMDSKNINDLLNTSTKNAMKWMAKKYPEIPPIEIDYLKSICQRYLGNELWCKFRTERDCRMGDVLKDIQKLINCYNAAVDKLTDVITKEDLFSYPPFPLEFKSYLEQSFPYPKGYEFIPSNVRTSDNVSMVRDFMQLLKLPNTSAFKPQNAISMQQQIRSYCNQITGFKDPERVVCKVVAVLPHELADINMSSEDFSYYFSHYDLIDFLNVVIYEKINSLNNFENRFAVYEKSVLQEYCNMNWLYEVKSLSELKHKAIDYEDEADMYIKAKRRKLAMDSLEYLMLEDKDSTLVEASLQEAEADISKLSDCSEAVKQLEKEIEEGTKKSVEFENMLRAALADV